MLFLTKKNNSGQSSVSGEAGEVLSLSFLACSTWQEVISFRLLSDNLLENVQFALD